MAQFYLVVNEHREDKLVTFPNIVKEDEESNMFLMAFGGDRAPICGMTFLIYFLNVSNRLASSSENFMIFGADVDETSEVVGRFVLKFISDVKYLES